MTANHPQRAGVAEARGGMVSRLAVVTSCAIIAGASAAERQIADHAMTFLGITAGSGQTLSDVVALHGPATQWHTGDAASSESKLCYRIGEGPEAVIVVFGSYSEMASPKGQVNAIRVYGAHVPLASKRRCATASAAPSELQTSNGLRLAATPSDIAAILGPRPISQRNSMHFESCRKRHLERTHPNFQIWAGKTVCGFEDPQRPYENDCSSIDIRLKDGSAGSFELSRVQSIC